MKYSRFLKKVLVSIITCFMFIGFVPTVRAVETYTVTYTDGSSSEKYFPDQVYTVNAGDLVPAFEGTPTRDGWVFTTWNATYKNGEQTKETVTKNRIFSARWVKMPNHLDAATAVHATIRATDEFRQYGGFDLRDFTLIADTFTVNETVWNEERGCMTASVTFTAFYP